MSKPHESINAVKQASSLFGAYIICNLQADTGYRATVAVAKHLRENRRILILCSNDQLVRQTIASLKSDNAIVGNLDTRENISVVNVRDRRLDKLDVNNYDILIVDELHNEQRRAASLVATRFVDAMKTVLEFKSEWQLQLLNRIGVVIGPGGQKTYTNEIQTDAKHAIHNWMAISGPEPTIEASGTIENKLLAIDNELKAATLLLEFAHTTAAFAHLNNVANLVNGISAEHGIDLEEGHRAGAVMETARILRGKPWVQADAYEADEALSVTKALVQEIKEKLASNNVPSL